MSVKGQENGDAFEVGVRIRVGESDPVALRYGKQPPPRPPALGQRKEAKAPRTIPNDYCAAAVAA